MGPFCLRNLTEIYEITRKEIDLTEHSRSIYMHLRKLVMMKLSIVCLFLSLSCFANDSLEIGGKKYNLQINEIPCIKGASDLFDPVAQAIYNQMTRALCNIRSSIDPELVCLKIDENFLLRNLIVSQLKDKNYCSCGIGPKECVTFCSKYLMLDECRAICGGSCGPLFPQK